MFFYFDDINNGCKEKSRTDETKSSKDYIDNNSDNLQLREDNLGTFCNYDDISNGCNEKPNIISNVNFRFDSDSNDITKLKMSLGKAAMIKGKGRVFSNFSDRHGKDIDIDRRKEYNTNLSKKLR